MAVFTKDAPITIATMKLVKTLDKLADTKDDPTWWKRERLDQKAGALAKEGFNAIFKIFRAINLPFPKIPANIGAAAFDIVFPVMPIAKATYGTAIGDQQMIQDGVGKLLTHFALQGLLAALPGLVFFMEEEEMRNLAVKDSALARARNGSINISRIKRMITGGNTDEIEIKGDTWISLNRIGPLGAALLMMGASEYVENRARVDDEGKIEKPAEVMFEKAKKSFGVAAAEQPTLTGVANSFAVATGEGSLYHIQNMLRTTLSVFNPGILRNMFIKGVTDSESVNKRGMDFFDRQLNDMFTDNVLFHYGDKWLGNEEWAYANERMVAFDKNKVESMNLPHINLRGEIADPTQSPVLQWLSSNIDIFNSNRSEATKLDIELFDVLKNLPDNYEGPTIYSDPGDVVEWQGANGDKVRVKLMRGDHWEMIREARRRKAVELDILISNPIWDQLSYEQKADEIKAVSQGYNSDTREEMIAKLMSFDFAGAIEKDRGAFKNTGMRYKYTY